MADRDVDKIAWRVLSDLFRPGGEFGSYSAGGLRHLIGLRLEQEAQRAAVPEEELALAFERAMQELTGANRPPRDPADASDEAAERDDDEALDDF